MGSITEALKTDIAFVNGDFFVTPSGDLGTISGLANLKAALFRRLVTVPGSLVFRPTYGVGILTYQNSLGSFSIQQKLAELIKEQFEQDPRVQSVDSVSLDSSDDTPASTIVKVFLTPVGYTEQEMQWTPFSAGLG